ncbi:BTAD domain-containing putative transcriptional regulator [Streptomyces sp. NPDC051954]|uniref:AfsR/SARP family transcriptional regulator n=1 Tax=unclassified Streptomyces TaxID=2593676 RepID=UPI0034141C39
MSASNEDSLYFSVLGPVRAWRGKRELNLGSPQQRVVLAVLLLRRGRPVTVAEFVDAVWGEAPPPAAVSVLRTYASRLRKLLEEERGVGGPPRVLVSAADGYLLRVPERAVDLGVFEQRVAEGRKQRAAGELAAAADLLRAGLAQWEGVPLAGIPGPLAEVERSRLAEERLTVLESCLEIEVELGQLGEAVPRLISLTGEYPLREELCRLLMLAFYRSGRQAEALAAYRRTRGTLVAEVGVEPGVSLRDLHDRILAADASLLPERSGPQQRLSSREPGAAGQVAGPAQLPADLPTFTGREDELKQVRTLGPDTTTSSTVTVISGMAGIGKTALAVHWAHRIAGHYPDGQLYVNLRGFDPTGAVVSSSEAIRAFLDALGVPPQTIPGSLDAQTALYRSLLADQRVLVLLDNARDTEQVRPLLPGSADCLAIVTSRSQLAGLVTREGAQPLTLGPLPPAEAHDLLARRVGAVRLTAEPQAANEIIECCGRLPLALAVVAARAATNPGFTLATVAGELREGRGNLDALTGGDPTSDVRTVFSWSYDALSAPAARLFRLLGLHCGMDISGHAAAALAGLPLRETRGLLAEITRAHLLNEHTPGRYTLHDLLRVYAAERVAAQEPPKERDRAVERLAHLYLHTAAAVYGHVSPSHRPFPLGPPPPECEPLTFTSRGQALRWCEIERSNFVATVHQAAGMHRPDLAWQLTSSLWGFSYLRGHLNDWLNIAQASLESARKAEDPWGEAWSLIEVAVAHTTTRRFEESIANYREALALYQQLGDPYGSAQAVSGLGVAYLQAGQLDDALDYLNRALALSRANGDEWVEGIALAQLGEACHRLGRTDEAIDYLRRALVVLRATGYRWVEGVALDVLGVVLHQRLRHDESMESLHQALEIMREVGNSWGEADALDHLGDALWDKSRPAAARTRWQQALALLQESDRPEAEAVRGKLRRPDG